MKFLVAFMLSLALCAVPAMAAVAAPAAGSVASAKGHFSLRVGPSGEKLENGPNTVDLTLVDRSGKPVEGAELTVTPWMPTMGHGVWEKPVVKELGGGKYRVDNVVIIMGGVWELKVDVRKGEQKDLAVLPFLVSDREATRAAPQPGRTDYTRSLADYNIPNVTLIDQDGKRVNLRALVDSGKPVVLDFIFTTCTTICPVLSASLSNLSKSLGDKVQLVSITIDPEHDRPEQLKKYRERFGGSAGWTFLTGSREDVGRVLRAFNAFVVDKMSHEPLYLIHAPETAQWVRIKGLIGKKDLLGEYRRVAKQ